MTAAISRLRMENIHKRFGPTRALDGVSLEVQPGEVHALVGENGAGKITLMKILSGAHRPDGGHMTLDGRPYAPPARRRPGARGVAMIYQELALAPAPQRREQHHARPGASTPGASPTGAPSGGASHDALALLAHPEIRPDTPVGRLTSALQQLVEVARALVGDGRVIVFDEPTSSLTAAPTPSTCSPLI